MLIRKYSHLACIALCFLAVCAQAKEKSIFPKGCEPLSVTVGPDRVRLNAQLPKSTQYLYLIKNIGRFRVELKRVDSNDFLDLGWTEELRARRWSAIATHTLNYDMGCRVSEGFDETANCANSLAICRYTYALIPVASRGDYWVAQNLSWRPLVRAISRKGIRLRSGPRKARR